MSHRYAFTCNATKYDVTPTKIISTVGARLFVSVDVACFFLFCCWSVALDQSQKPVYQGWASVSFDALFICVVPHIY